MKKKWKWILGVLLVLLVAGGFYASVKMSQRGVVTVQTGKASRQDLVSLVTASGEIKPRNYYNIGANVMGRITDIYVKEGDKVRRSQVLAKLESVQAQADVQAQQAGLNSSMAESTAAEAGLKAMDENLHTATAAIDRAKADLERAKLEYDRGESLFKEKLIAKQDFDSRKAALDSASASLREAEARLSQMNAQREQTAAQLSVAQKRIAQSKATLSRFDDVLSKHQAVSPIDGVVTNLPVRVGETVVPGIQNSAASLIMTIADMSLDHRRGEGGRDRHREREARPEGRRHHRRHSQQDLQGARDRDRQYGDPALHRPGRHPERRFQPGSEGLQGGGRSRQSAR